MTPISMMLYFGIAATVGFLVAGYNMLNMIAGGMMRGKLRGHQFVIHILFAGLMAVGILGVIGGFVWFLIDKYAG